MHRPLLFSAALGLCLCTLPNAFSQSTGTGNDRATSLWTIGIYTGPSPLQLSAPPGVHNPVLRGADVKDLKVDTLAHPFMLIEGSGYYLFFTAKDHKTDKSGIGLAESTNGLDWEYKRIAVQEPFTLGHPFVFKSRNEYY